MGLVVKSLPRLDQGRSTNDPDRFPGNQRRLNRFGGSIRGHLPDSTNSLAIPDSRPESFRIKVTKGGSCSEGQRLSKLLHPDDNSIDGVTEPDVRPGRWGDPHHGEETAPEPTVEG